VQDLDLGILRQPVCPAIPQVAQARRLALNPDIFVPILSRR
jgi:hypothetical protein